MSTVFIILLVLICLALIGYPLFRSPQAESKAETKPLRRNLAKDKEILMSTLGEIEFDYHMKKLSDEDYQSLKNNYAGAAVAIMKEEEGSPKAKVKSKGKAKTSDNNLKNIEQEIEDELKALDAKGSNDKPVNAVILSFSHKRSVKAQKSGKG